MVVVEGLLDAKLLLMPLTIEADDQDDDRESLFGCGFDPSDLEGEENDTVVSEIDESDMSFAEENVEEDDLHAGPGSDGGGGGGCGFGSGGDGRDGCGLSHGEGTGTLTPKSS